jgi:hypothetical protein
LGGRSFRQLGGGLDLDRAVIDGGGQLGRAVVEDGGALGSWIADMTAED